MVKAAIFILYMLLAFTFCSVNGCYSIVSFNETEQRRNNHCHFVSFYSASMIEFTVTLQSAVARKHYLTIQSNTFTVDINRFQTD